MSGSSQARQARRPRASQDRQARRLTVTVLTVTTLIVLLPLAILALWSLATRWPWPELLPAGITSRGWESLLAPYGGAMAVLGSSMALSAVVAILAIAVSLPAARALTLRDFRGRKLLQFAVFLPVIVSSTAFAMGIHPLLVQLGVHDSLAGVLVVHVILCLPYTVKILCDVCAGTGERLEVQGRVLGASPARVFLHITFPMVAPGLVSSLCMAFIVSFSQYFVTMLVGGGRVVTFAMFLFPYISSGDRTMAAVYSLIFIAASLLVFLLFDWLVKRYYNIEDVTFYG